MKSNLYSKSSNFKSLIFGLIIFLTLLSTSMYAQTLTVQAPNGGEVWTYGQNEIISWTGNDLGSIVSIDFSYDGGTNWWYFG
jgi:hypothetical protein